MPTATLSVSAPTDCGKTRFAMSMPSSLYINLDPVGNFEPIYKQYGKNVIEVRDRRAIAATVLTAKEAEVVEACKKVTETVNRDIEEALNNPLIKSIVIDPLTYLDQWERITIFGERGTPDEIKDFKSYAIRNVYMNNLLARCQGRDKNLLVTNYLSPKFRDESNYKLDGYGGMRSIIPYDFWMFRVPSKITQGGFDFRIQVKKFKPNYQLVDQWIDGNDTVRDFPTLMAITHMMAGLDSGMMVEEWQ